ncbi:MAG: amidohydrolase family protein [Candidatus Levybacteria bacterium]|nr:amidohydrolase family protein [Candidatus Levybacteria bacterium]
MATLIFPGLIDPHVHLRDPGQTEKEDFYTGSCAALAGGFTTILDMPNNKVPITTFDRLEEKVKIAKEKIVCDTGFYFGSLGDNIEEFEKVNGKVFGIKLYLDKTTGNYLINEKNLKDILNACPDENSSQTLALHSNRVLAKLSPILIHAEDRSLEQVLKAVKETRKSTHICHISLQSELEQIIKAKNEGLPITCGVTPHHLLLTENDVKTLGPFGKMKPSLKSKKDVDFLWKNLKYIDVIESDHAPHTIDEKLGKIQLPTPGVEPQIPSGVPGLETTLPLLLTAVSENRLTIDEIIRLCHDNPSKIFKIKTDKETKVEIDSIAKYTIENKNLFTKCGWSPFDGWGVKGKIERVFIRGIKVYQVEKIFVNPGFGKVITPK